MRRGSKLFRRKFTRALTPEPGQALKSLDQTSQSQEVRMGQSRNGKRSRQTGSRTRRKRWKNRCKRANHPNARFLAWFPSISNGLLTVASHWWNVLTVRERAHSLRAMECSASHRMTNAKRVPQPLPDDGHGLIRPGRSLAVKDSEMAGLFGNETSLVYERRLTTRWQRAAS